MHFVKVVNPTLIQLVTDRVKSKSATYSHAIYEPWFGFFDNGTDTAPCIVYGTNYVGDCYTIAGNCPGVVPKAEVFPVGMARAATHLASLGAHTIPRPNDFVTVTDDVIKLQDTACSLRLMIRDKEAQVEEMRTKGEQAVCDLAETKKALSEFKILFQNLFQKDGERGVSVRVAGGVWSKLARADAEALRIFF